MIKVTVTADTTYHLTGYDQEAINRTIKNLPSVSEGFGLGNDDVEVWIEIDNNVEIVERSNDD